uniref:Ribosomal protein S6 kinase like 1 n=1 Tax=Latimeria chalumnae TaxID=7897 RepID=H3BI19_LATCH
KRDYLVDAAKQIRLALDKEVSEEYEAAFNHYKNGVDLLLKGVQVDSNRERREAVKRKITQYLKRAEEIFNCHLQRSLRNGASQSEGFSSFRFRPIRILSSPVEDLKMCKVIGVLDKVLLVQEPSTKEHFVVKSLCKSSVGNRERQTIIPQGVPFMVRLLRYYISEDTVFLHLEHVQGGKLWSHLRKCQPSNRKRVKEYPECSSPIHKTIKLKNSYTSPTLKFTYEEENEACKKEHRKKINEKDFSEGNTESIHDGFIQNGPTWGQLACQRNQIKTSDSQEKCFYQSVVNQEKHCNGEHQNNCMESVTSAGRATHAISSSSETMHEFPKKMTEQDDGYLGSNNKILSSLRSFPNEDRFNLLSKQELPSPSQSIFDETLKENQLAAKNSRKVTGPVRSPVRAIDLNLKAMNLEKRKDSYKITINPLVEMEGNTKVANNLEDSHLAQLGPFGAMPVKQMAVTFSGKEQMEQKTSVQVVNATVEPDPSGNLISSEFQMLSMTDKGQKEEGNIWSLLNPTDVGLAVKGQAKKQNCDKNKTGSEDPSTCQNGFSKTDRSPSVDWHIEVDGWCLVSFQQHQKEEKLLQISPWGISEDQIQLWAAEIVLALENLHQQGVVCQDLNPRNILLDSTGQIQLTYFGQWGEIDLRCCTKAIEEMYSAPEVGGFSEVTEACDWWSLGALLYELLTGMSLSQSHPSGIHAHTRLQIPDTLSIQAASVLTELLQFDASCRLGTGEGGIEEIKSHPFFSTIQWNKLCG